MEDTQMKNLFRTLALVAALAMLAVPGFAQTGGISEANLNPDLDLLVNGGLMVRNATGSTIAANALVYICGYTETSGGIVRKQKVCLADADVAGARAMFIMPRSLTTATNGEAWKKKRVTSVNTLGSTVGNPVYLSQTAGSWTLTAPPSKQVVGRVAVVSATIGEIEFNLGIEGLSVSGVDTGVPTVVYWNGVDSLQAIITAITDATSAKPYTIMIPPGTFNPGALAGKPWVNLRGAGGRGRMTVFAGTGTSSFTVDATAIAGTSRFRMDGIRFETVPVTFTKPNAGGTLVVTVDDCPMNSNSPVHTHGYTYGAASTMVNIEFSNLNMDHNTITQTFQLSRVTFRNCTLLGMYFQDSDAYFYGNDISSGCNFVNSATSAGGWFEFAGNKIDTMVLNDPTSESVLATAFASDNENVQIHNIFHGYTAPGSISYWGRIQPGALYFCNTDSKLYVKTGAVGTNTWVVAGTQS
jgi:hypothetical protein